MFIIVHMAYFKNTTDSNHRDTLRNNSGADSSWSSFSFRAIEADAHRSVILTLSPKLVTWKIVLHMHLRILVHTECWTRWRRPAWRGKLRMKLFLGGRLKMREGVVFAPMKSAIDFDFETWAHGRNCRQLSWRHQVVSFPWKWKIARYVQWSRSVTFLRPVVRQWWRWRRR